MIYDPMLEPELRVEEAPAVPWQAHWVWFPGQLAAHLNPRIFQKAIARCTHIGYPGNFRQPEYFAVFRCQTNLAEDTPVRWAAPRGRVRVRINGREGDITVRSGRIPKGLSEVQVFVDLTETLPCFLLEPIATEAAVPVESASQETPPPAVDQQQDLPLLALEPAVGLLTVATGTGWEASLDGEHWLPAEFLPAFGAPDHLPDVRNDVHLPLLPKKVVSLRNGVEVEGITMLDPGGALLLDFWHDELGELEIEAAGAGVLRVSVGESILEAQDTNPLAAEQYPLDPLPLTESGGSFRLPERCLRYVYLQAEDACRVTRVVFHARIYPVEYRGAFSSSDAQLNEIWQAGAATLHSNLHDAAALDGLKRDALVWLYDQNIDFDASDLLFWDRAIVRNTILSKSLPAVPQRKDIGLIDAYLYYILGFYQDYLASGDVEFLTRYRERITELLNLLESLQDRYGFLSARTFSPRKTAEGKAGVEGVDYLNEFFPDWAGKRDQPGKPRPTDLENGGTPAYAQMMLMRCFEIGALFANLWQDVPLAERYAANAKRMRAAIRAAFWDAPRGVFINGFTRKGARDDRVSNYAQAWAILTGLIDGAFANRLAQETASLDPRPANLSMSTYWEYLAYVSVGRFDLALDGLRCHWGAQLERGLSRFIEDIRPADDEPASLAFYGRPYALSLNHGWTGATAVSILMRGALGLQVLEPGYALVELRPNWRMFDQLSVRIPSPLGDLALEYVQAAATEASARNSTDTSSVEESAAGVAGPTPIGVAPTGVTLHLPAGMRVQLRDGETLTEFEGPGTFTLAD